ncbi:MAG: O-antigen polymerase [Fulvivirga sp.]|uniref:O-antigen polymerase n=1 Tax=Fulvivirga sp. TaxID=1931237 RepID=UPI0032EB77C6
MIKTLKIALIVWLIFFVIPVDPIYDFNLFAGLYIGGCYLFFFSGILIYQGIFRNAEKSNTRFAITTTPNLGVYFYLGVLGMFFRFVDRYYLRGIVLSSDFDEVLMALDNTSITLIGILGSLLFFFCYIPFLLELLTKRPKWIYFFLFLIPVIDSILIGQRFQVLTAMVLALWAFFYYRSITFKRVISIAVVASLVLGIGVVLIIIRYMNHGMELYYSLTESGYAQTLQPTDWILKGQDESIAMFYIKFIISNMGQYFYHGIYEFSYLMDFNPHIQPKLGQSTFKILYQITSPLTGFNKDFWDQLPHKGIYLSYFGLLYVDFGLLGLFFQFIFGALWIHSLRMVKSGQIHYFLLYSYLSYVIIMMPVTSMISYGLGNNILTIAFITIAIGNRKFVIRQH